MRLPCLWLLILYSCAGYVGTSGPLHYHSTGFLLLDSANPVQPGVLKAGETSDFPIYYIGPLSDTIAVGERYWRGMTAYPETTLTAFTKSYSSKDLEITVDTSISCYAGIEVFNDAGQQITDSTRWYHSFLLTLKNKSDSTLYMGRTFSLYYIQLEGQRPDGQWIVIQKPLSEQGLCLTNQPDIFLRPGEIILSKIIRRADPGFTKYRFAWVTYYSVVYSNTFTL
jgi:hypothetical protein